MTNGLKNSSLNGNSTASSVFANFPTKTIHILIVDDQKMIREGLKALLQSEADFEVVGTAHNGEIGIQQVEALKPDVVLIDMEMPEMDGATATRAICEKFPNTKVLVLSSYGDEEYVTQSLEAGAKGYILKGTPAHEIRETIRSVHKGYLQIGPGLFDNIKPGSLQVRDGKLEPKESTLVKPTVAETIQNLAKADSSGGSPPSLTVATKPEPLNPKFDEAVLLRQSPTWSRAIVWTIASLTTFGLGWSAIAKIEQVVPAQGKLEPQEKVKEIQVPLNGVVKEVHVEEGQKVTKGQLLVTLDSQASLAELQSQKSVRQALALETAFYRNMMSKPLDNSYLQQAITELKLPREILFLARNRVELIGEIEYYRAQLKGTSQGSNLNPGQLDRLSVAQTELSSRAAQAKLEKKQLEKQLTQNQVQQIDTKNQLATNILVLEQIKSRTQSSVAQAQASLAIEEGILSDVEPLVAEGALAKVQRQKQEQSVNDRRAKLVEEASRGKIELEKQAQQIETDKAKIAQLKEEEQRLRYNMSQADAKLVNTTYITAKEILDKVADNQKRISEIDSQLTKIIVENEKRISEIDSQISRSEQTLKYQELRAPVSGTVFDMKATMGYVPQPGPNQPVLKIVPDENLVAKVFITNRDVGFVEMGKKVDVRIDAFPYNEFGDIKGQVVSIGSDALPPDQVYNYFRFPVEIKLDKQAINIRGKDVSLQSGMSLNANIKINENRTVLSLFLDELAKGVDAFKGMR